MPPNVKMCDDDNYQSDIKRVGLFKWLRDKLNQILRRKQDRRGRCFKAGSARVLKKTTRNVGGAGCASGCSYPVVPSSRSSRKEGVPPTVPIFI